MSPGLIDNTAMINLSTGKTIIKKNEIKTPVPNINKSALLKTPNLSILFLEFAGIKNPLFIYITPLLF